MRVEISDSFSVSYFFFKFLPTDECIFYALSIISGVVLKCETKSKRTVTQRNETKRKVAKHNETKRKVTKYNETKRKVSETK